MEHVTVLGPEAMTQLAVRPGLNYVDATVGGGGHSALLLAAMTYAGGSGQLLACDQDPVALEKAKARLINASLVNPNITFIQCNYSELAQPLQAAKLLPITGGILADLGTSAFQLETAQRGFSFRLEGPLDMRMDPQLPLTAADMINTYSEAALIDLFTRYGEARLSKRIAQAIVTQRKTQPFETTVQLAGCIEQVYAQNIPKTQLLAMKTHPATTVFQALRIAVNNEMAHLEAFLAALPQWLAPGARAVIITFHSLEDRLVKQSFRQGAKGCVCPPRFPVCQCGQSPVYRVLSGNQTAGPDELQHNPRARSARLRSIERL